MFMSHPLPPAVDVAGVGEAGYHPRRAAIVPVAQTKCCKRAYTARYPEAPRSWTKCGALPIIELAPGTYEVYWPVDNHAEEGMRLELTVT
jgi:hypothetical protein